jgi:Tfp pilus assembly protein PilW
MIIIKNFKRGTTLIELLIVIPILAIMVVAFSSIYITSLRNYQNQFTQTNLQTDGQSILDNMLNNIKTAGGVEATNGAYTSGAQTLILELPSIDANQNFVYTANALDYDTYIYYLNGTSLHQLILANAASSRFAENNLNTVLSTQISNLSFTYTPGVANATSVAIGMTLSNPVVNYNDNIVLSGKANMRNLP